MSDDLVKVSRVGMEIECHKDLKALVGPIPVRETKDNKLNKEQEFIANSVEWVRAIYKLIGYETPEQLKSIPTIYSTMYCHGGYLNKRWSCKLNDGAIVEIDWGVK